MTDKPRTRIGLVASPKSFSLRWNLRPYHNSHFPGVTSDLRRATEPPAITDHVNSRLCDAVETDQQVVPDTDIYFSVELIFGSVLEFPDAACATHATIRSTETESHSGIHSAIQ